MARQVEYVSKELILAARSGDNVAFETIAARNVGLIIQQVSVYKRARRHDGMVEDDLMQAGTIGLWKAVRDFNLDEYTLGAWSTYVYSKIRYEMQEQMGFEDGLARNVALTRNLLVTLEEMLTESIGRPPTDEELAGALLVKRPYYSDNEAINYVQNLRDWQRPLSLDYEMDGDEGDTQSLLDMLIDSTTTDPVDNIARAEVRDAVLKTLGKFPKKWAKVFIHHHALFGSEMWTMYQVADFTSVNRNVWTDRFHQMRVQIREDCEALLT